MIRYGSADWKNTSYRGILSPFALSSLLL